MKNTLRIAALLIAALTVIPLLFACNSDTEETTDSQSIDVTETVADIETDAFSITESNGSADVSSGGISYKAYGYEKIENGKFRIKDNFLAEFNGSVKNEFNYVTLKYSSSEPLKIYLRYTENNAEKTDGFFVEAAEQGAFGCLIRSYSNNGHASELLSLRAGTCTENEADFILLSVETDNREYITRSTYYIENERFKLGVSLDWGGGINYIEDKADNIKDLSNLVNNHDTGRLVQQSYYGTAGNNEYEPGTSFNTKWPYNPVQGGDQFGNASRIIDFYAAETSFYVKSQPQDWALDGKITPSYMENTYTLYDDHIRVDSRFVDFSGWEHRYSGQELPAFYTVSYLSKFAWYDGVDSWQDGEISYRDDLQFWGDHDTDCTFPFKLGSTETWCAWVSGDTDFGVGLYVPNVDVLKAGRYAYNGSMSADNDATNYVAPVNVIKLVSFKPLEYSYLITSGSLKDIRDTFKKYKDFTDNSSLHNDYVSGRILGSTDKIIEGKFDSTDSLLFLSNIFASEAEFSDEYGAVIIKAVSDNGDPSVTVDYTANEAVSTDEYKTLTIEYMIPEENGCSSYSCDLFICAGDTYNPDPNMRLRESLVKNGQFHTLTVDLSAVNFFVGDIHKIRFDYFDYCLSGDVIYLKSFNLS